MYTLGISAFYHDSAACILKGDEVMAAVQEERFTRIKNDLSFPTNAIKYCLDFCGIKLSQVNQVVFYEKPFLKFERLVETYFAFAPLGLRSYLTAMPLWVKEKLFTKKIINKLLKGIDDGWRYNGNNLLFAEHHQSHAASAFYPSPYDEAIILTMDGVGEWATTSIWKGSGNTMQLLKEIKFPHSIGLLYSAFTYYLGFKVNCDEYKVMGLAPYGKPIYAGLILDNLIDVKDDGSFKLNLEYFNYCTGLTMTNCKFDKLFGKDRRKAENELDQFHMDVASSIQKVTEEVELKIAKLLVNEYGIKNLCMAGGVALNCVANGRLLKESGFENIWVQPAAGDAGGALGAAFAACYDVTKEQRIVKPGDAMKNALLGPSFTREQIIKELNASGVNYSQFESEAFYDEVAARINDGYVIGRFCGRMEFGPRALGSRSIIADARNPQMQSVINRKIKFRESFRPFAPAVLEEHATEYFDLSKPSPYMLFTAQVIDQHQIATNRNTPVLNGFEKMKQMNTIIPAVTHVDNSARVQTVNESTPEFHRLITAFYKLTGFPLMINTSFNVMDEPIVCTPADAIRCFLNSGLDILAFDGIVVYKNDLTATNKLQLTAECAQ